MTRVEGWAVADFFSYRTFQALRKTVSYRASLAAYCYPGEVSVSFAVGRRWLGSGR